MTNGNTSQFSEHKVIQVGNSLAVTLPVSFVKSRKVKAGQTVFVESNPNIDNIQIKTHRGKESVLTPEFYSWLNQFNKRYKTALTELAKK